MMDLVKQVGPELGIVAACIALGLAPATYYRHQQPPMLARGRRRDGLSFAAGALAGGAVRRRVDGGVDWLETVPSVALLTAGFALYVRSLDVPKLSSTLPAPSSGDESMPMRNDLLRV